MTNKCKLPPAEVLEFLRHTPNTVEAHKTFGFSRRTIQRWLTEYLPDVEKTPRGRPKIKIPETVIPRLGREPDYVLAVEFNLSPTTLRRARARLGIPATPRGRGRAEKSPDRIGGRQPTQLADSLIARLGKQSDASLALKHNLGVWVIRNARLQRGIPPHQIQRRLPPSRPPQYQGAAPGASVAMAMEV